MRAADWRGLCTSRGFTLLELLIAMSLLGLIFAAVTGGLRFGTTAWQRTADRLSQSDDMQLTYQILRRQISTSVTLYEDTGPGQEEVSFSGRRDRLSFIGPAPARAMAPGLFRLTLSLEPDAGAQALTLRWQRVEKAVAKAGPDNVEPVLRGVRSIQFSYFGHVGNDRRPRWVNEWRDRDRAPTLVRIAIGIVGQKQSPWPAMVIPVMAPNG